MWRIIAFDRDGREVNRMEVDGGEITIGRDTDRAMILPAASVSRRHAKLVLSGPQPFIVDEGSANGVIVNGVRIAGPTAVVPGVRVDIAEFHLEFEQPGTAGFTEAVPPIAGPGAMDAAPGGGEDVVRLLAQGGPFDGRIYEIPAGEIAVGRATDNDVVLDDPSLSRKHAKVRRLGSGRIEVEDLGSSNGTYINGRKVPRGDAGPGENVRFGDLIFKIQGAAGADGTRTVGQTSGGGGSGLVIILILLFVLLAAGGAVAFILVRKPFSGKDLLAKQTAEAAEHMKAGKARMADKKFDAAKVEFTAAVKLDPTNSDARKLLALADGEKQNEDFSKRVGAKISVGDLKALESAARLLGQIPEESQFRESTAKKLSGALVTFAAGQCKTKKWSDCAWAVCKAYEVAPPKAKPESDASALLTTAEKKLTKDKSYTPCKVKR